MDELDRICHELRRPIAVVAAYAELLDEQITGPLNAGQRELLSKCALGAREMDRLIGELYRTAEIGAGHARVDRRPCCLEQLLSDLADAFEPRCVELGIRLSILTDGPLQHPRIDAALLGEALGVLVDNAIASTPENGRINVRLMRTEGGARIEVRDSGPGIAPEYRERVFDPFFRVPDGPGGAGFGLGLTRCATLVGLLGGELRAMNGPVQGALFVLELPFESEEWQRPG